jgi:hypothetical protein
MQNDIADLIEAVDNIADTNFDASARTNTDASVHTNCTGDRITDPVVLNLLSNPRFPTRRSGSTTTGFLDGERKSGGVTPTTCPPYLGPPSGRAGTADEKRGAWQLQEEYLAGRLGKNEEENGRNWNTATWMDKLLRIGTMPAEALPPLNIYVGDKISQSTEGTGAPTGPDDEAPDEAGNEGIEFESINVGKTDSEGESDSERSMCVMDEDGTTHRLDIKIDDYDLLRLMDDFEECDELAEIDINKLALTAYPLPEQINFPGPIERQEAIKILRMLMLGMDSLWHPVIRAIADHATMTSLGQGKKGKGIAAAVGRQRVIEGLRLAESIRKRLARQDRPFSMWQNQIRARQVPIRKPGLTAARRQASVDEIIKAVLIATTPVISMPMIGDYEPIEIRQDNDSDTPTRSSLLVTIPDQSLPMPVRAPPGHYWNLAAGPVIKLPDNRLPVNDNRRVEAVAFAA